MAAPLKISREAFQKSRTKLQQMEVHAGYQRSLDEENFPVYRGGDAGERHLIYIPNHSITIDGVPQLRYDRALLHDCKVSKNDIPTKMRCVQGLSELTGREDDSCPLCEIAKDARNNVMDIGNAALKLHGFDQGTKNEQTKKIWVDAFSNLTVDEPEESYAFPIVVIEMADPKEGSRNIVPKQVDGKAVVGIYWAVFSKSRMYKIDVALEGSEEPHPGGQFFMFRYGGEPGDRGKPTSRRDAGRDLTITLRPKESNLIQTFVKGGFPAKWDKATEEWDEFQAFNVVVDHLFHDFDNPVNAALLSRLRDRTAAMRQIIDGTPAAGQGAVDPGQVAKDFNVSLTQGTPDLGVLPEGSVDSDDSAEDSESVEGSNESVEDSEFDLGNIELD